MFRTGARNTARSRQASIARTVTRFTSSAADPDSVESVDAAIDELTRLYVEADARRGRLGRRLDELRMGAKELRRGRARSQLDAFLPQLRLVSIERVDEPPPPATLPGVLGVLFDALGDVLRIWWGKHFMPWWRRAL